MKVKPHDHFTPDENTEGINRSAKGWKSQGHYGIKNPKAKLTPSKVKLARWQRTHRWSLQEIADYHGVSVTAIFCCTSTPPKTWVNS